MQRTSQLTTLTAQDYWRAIVLYGNNVATYKIALADCLIAFAEAGAAVVTTLELATAFFHRYRERLGNGGQPQQTNTTRKTVLERVVEAYHSGLLLEEAAIVQVARQGFGDVVPRFHTVNGASVAEPFYEATDHGLVLTDSLLTLFHGTGEALERRRQMLQAEVASRWDMLEAAFTMHLPLEVLGTDAHMVYRTKGHDRVDITSTRPVLNGYQNGYCFYCGELLGVDCADTSSIHVDHVIPRTFLQHDDIWNLVLAHDSCNLAKSSLLPELPYLDKLYERNEYYIASNHPIKRHLVEQMGETPIKRRAFLERTYREAERILIHVWPGMPGGLLRTNPLASLRLTARL